MKLRAKMMMIGLLPIFLLGIGIYILAADRTANGIYNEAYSGMQAAALAVRDIFEVGHKGAYTLDDQGDLWKGETLNITQAVSIVDHIKDNTGLDVTIFWGDTRILTSMKDESGQRQIHTKAPEKAVKKVLQDGDYYFDRHVDILGTEYVVCYAPFYQEHTDTPIGMIFLGKPQVFVSEIIHEIRMQMMVSVIAVLLLTALTVILLVNRIVNALGKSMGLLQQIADGNLTVQVDAALLNRADEVGMLGREILQLRDKFRAIADMLHEKSTQLDLTSTVLKDHTQTILQLMKGLDESAQEMSTSCVSQAEDASAAGSSVTQMGEMIVSSNQEIQTMYQISSQIQDMSEHTMTEILELYDDMKQVRTSIAYLSKQTVRTKESADKINRASELIAAVAAQTSLLALNASIEAARAGDLGKGFGVVASEIQKLAVQSNESVSDICAMVEDLTENADHTISRMDDVQAVIQKQQQNIEKTGQIFENVRNEVQNSASHMKTVISGSTNMEEIRTDMVDTVQNSAALAQQNAASIQEVMAALETAYEEIQVLSEKTEELGELSLQMKESVHVFNVKEA